MPGAHLVHLSPDEAIDKNRRRVHLRSPIRLVGFSNSDSDRRNFTSVEVAEQERFFGLGCPLNDLDPSSLSQLLRARQPSPIDNHLVEDLPGNMNRAEEGRQEREVSDPAQVNERAGVCDDDHRLPSCLAASNSASRSSGSRSMADTWCLPISSMKAAFGIPASSAARP